MRQNDPLYSVYLNILHEELQPAFGCTEPAALAYASALASETLGRAPERLLVTCSGNIIKNVKSVIVPNAGGRKGLDVAAAAGVIAGHAERKLELLSGLTESDRQRMDDYLKTASITVALSDSPNPFDIRIDAASGSDTARVRITGGHTNVVLIEKNGEVLLEKSGAQSQAGNSDRTALTVRQILAFADGVDIANVRGVLDRQIACNMAIAVEDGVLHVTRPNDAKENRALHGLTRTLIHNMVVGVTEGFKKELDVNGVGYRVAKEGNKLVMNLGFSHQVIVEEVPGISIEVPSANKIVILGCDKQQVGQFAAEVREKRPPEPYKGKGIKYTDEVIRRKAGKTGAKK